MTATATSYNPSYRYGNANPVQLPFKAAVAVNVGDFVFEDETDSYTVKPAMSVTWQTAIADPTVAPTTSAIASPNGPGLGAGTGYLAYYTWVTSTGLESGPSPASSAQTITANQGIQLKSAAAVPAGVVAINWYLSNASGTSPQLVGQAPYAGGLAVVAAPPSDSPTYPAANSLSALILTQQYFAQRFAGISGQAFDGTNTTAYGIQDGFLRVDTMGVFDFACAAATYNTGDILTLAKDTGNNLTGQTVVLAGTAQQAVLSTVKNISLARVVVPYTSNTTVVRAELVRTRFGQPLIQ